MAKIKLKEVSIGGYKSIAYDKPITLKLDDVNILLGANGAGKSNIVSFFQMLSFMMSKKFGLYVASNGDADTLLHYGSKNTQSISGNLKFSFKDSIDTYEFLLRHVVPNKLIFLEERVFWYRQDADSPFTANLIPLYHESAITENKNKVVRSIFRMLDFCKVYQFHDTSKEGPLRTGCPVETSNYLQAYGNNLPSFLLLLKENYRDSYNKIVFYIQNIAPQFKDFYLEPLNNYISLRWTDNSATDYVFNAYQLSDGTLRFMALATLLLQPREIMPNVIIIDEPELGLHPFAINQLAEMIKDASRHTQIIVATQSKDLVDNFDIENISVVEMDKETQSTSVKQLTEEEYHHWLEEYMISELWDKNVIGGTPL
jgi:predicted ATPase